MVTLKPCSYGLLIDHDTKAGGRQSPVLKSFETAVSITPHHPEGADAGSATATTIRGPRVDVPGGYNIDVLSCRGRVSTTKGTRVVIIVDDIKMAVPRREPYWHSCDQDPAQWSFQECRRLV